MESPRAGIPRKVPCHDHFIFHIYMRGQKSKPIQAHAHSSMHL